MGFATMQTSLSQESMADMKYISIKKEALLMMNDTDIREDRCPKVLPREKLYTLKIPKQP
ncbi:hypothetical protein YC2023_118906 [Brassica napus]